MIKYTITITMQDRYTSFFIDWTLNCIKTLWLEGTNSFLPSLWTESSQLNNVTFCWGWNYFFLLSGLATHTYINILWGGGDRRKRQENARQLVVD
jgi:hypothetical protein